MEAEDWPPADEPGERSPTGCLHPTHRTVRLFCSYGPASVVRLGVDDWAAANRLKVSALRQIPGGWSFTICARCAADARDAHNAA